MLDINIIIMENNCRTCNGKGWISTVVYGKVDLKEGTSTIEKCDECEFFSSDEDAMISVKSDFQFFKISISDFYIFAEFSLN